MRKDLIAMVHIAKKDLGLDEVTYRQTLRSTTAGKDSCKDMSSDELRRVLASFKDKGWKSTKKNSRYSPRTRDRLDNDMVSKIRAIWITMFKSGIINDGSEDALDAWVARTTVRLNKGKGIERAEWLRGARVSLVIAVLESLKKWQDRVNLQWKNEDLRLISEEQNRADIAQTEVVQDLLNRHAIFWWPIFRELGIKDSVGYCRNRKELHHV